MWKDEKKNVINTEAKRSVRWVYKEKPDREAFLTEDTQRGYLWFYDVASGYVQYPVPLLLAHDTRRGEGAIKDDAWVGYWMGAIPLVREYTTDENGKDSVVVSKWRYFQIPKEKSLDKLWGLHVKGAEILLRAKFLGEELWEADVTMCDGTCTDARLKELARARGDLVAVIEPIGALGKKVKGDLKKAGTLVFKGASIGLSVRVGWQLGEE